MSVTPAIDTKTATRGGKRKKSFVELLFEGRAFFALIAIVVVFFELWAIAWIQNHYMETPFFRAAIQVVLGGSLVLAAGILIVFRRRRYLTRSRR